MTLDTRLHNNLPDGCALVWRNEFTGEDHVGLNGLYEFAGAGSNAREWLHDVVIPAIVASASR